MASLKDMLRKAQRALLRRGVAAQDAEDLVHEAFVRVGEYERRQSVKSQEAMLITVAVNISVDRARRRRVSPFVDVGDGLASLADTTPPPDEIVRAQARLRHAALGLERLPERTRRILLSRRLDGMSYRDIADREGLTISAVEKQVARATLELMKWMDGW